MPTKSTSRAGARWAGGGAALAAVSLAQGCVAYTVASTAVGVTATVVETTVDVGAAAVGGAVDLVTDDED
jgi:hypothetical protein